jgi:L-threonylcarbamoyladenylate synthase
MAAGGSLTRRFPVTTSRLGTTLIRKVRAHLKNGGVIAYPTESCYGLGCDPRNGRAVQRLLRLKQRPQSKGLLLVADRFERLAPFVAALDTQEHASLKQWWPGPFTLLLPASRKTPRWLRGAHDSIGVRVTAHPEAASLCRRLGMALVSSSANRSGLRPLKTYADCTRAFGRDALVLRGKIGKRKSPSTIIDFKNGRLIRK